MSSAMKSMRPMSKNGLGVPIAATVRVPQPGGEVQTSIEKEDDVSIQVLLAKIRNVNDNANACVEQLRSFNQKVSEQISSSAKQQILKLGEQIIEPRIKEQYKLVGRLSQQVQQPEHNSMNLTRLNERVTTIETKINNEQVLKLTDDVQKIKNLLLKIVKAKKQ